MKPIKKRDRQYIVFDLEWNQSAEGKAGEIPDLPFEIIEIGAVKLDEDFRVIGTFSRFIRPEVYRKLHFKVLEIMHLGMEELRSRGEAFEEVMQAFFLWCEEDFKEGNGNSIFCTWGNMDLTELQRNMTYHGIKNPFPYPLLYYDIQKLYNKLYHGDSKDKVTLERAVQALGLETANPFHRAIEDAKYTASILKSMDFHAVETYLSLDYYRIPDCVEDEIYLVFPDYSKYVSHGFSSREALIRDKTVTDLICFRCNRMLRKKIRWFSVNQRNHMALGICPEHGYLRGKLRVRKTPDGNYYCVKTIRMTDEDGASEFARKKEEYSGKHREKMRLKRMRKKERSR